MDQALRLTLYGFHNFGMAMACGDYRDAGVEIQKTVAIDVFDHSSLTPADNQRVGARV